MSNDHNLGQRLVQAGILTHEQLTEALEYQCRLPSSQMMDIEEILVSFEYITESELISFQGKGKEQIDSEVSVNNLLNKLDSPDLHQDPPPQQTTLPASAQLGKMLGQIMLENNLIHEWQLVHALCSQKEQEVKTPLGTLLVQLGYAGKEQVAKALSIQVNASKPAQIQAHEDKQHLRLGDLLLKANIIKEWQLQHALSLQMDPKHNQKGLGTLLVQLGYASKDAVAQALYQQKQSY